jgi:hypothetical protein
MYDAEPATLCFDAGLVKRTIWIRIMKAEYVSVFLPEESMENTFLLD